MTLEHVVVYGGIVVGIWLIGIITFLAAGQRHGPVLHLDVRRGAARTRARPSVAPGQVASATRPGTAREGLASSPVA